MRTALLLALALAAGCKGEAAKAQEEKRGLEKSVSEAGNRVHELKMKELNGGELSEAERAEKARLEEQAYEDEHGGEGPQPPPAEAPEPG